MGEGKDGPADGGQGGVKPQVLLGGNKQKTPDPTRPRRGAAKAGSGKSPLLNILGGLDRPTSGRYFLGDTDVSEMDDDQLSEVRCTYLGFIFQSYNLLPQYTVVENIELPLLYQGVKLDEATKQR